MTPSPLSWLPIPSSLDSEPAPEEELTEEERAGLQLAAAAGERAAAWVRELARRQPVEVHGRVLELTAEAIEQTCTREIIPGNDDDLAAELRYRLDGGVLLGATNLETLPELTRGERIALAAVAALALAMPGTAVTWYERELPHLSQVMDDAIAAGRAAEPRR
ncbi:hypothetical protein ACFXPX_13880 [Kitasatospora sp. NPDC059146]|uniref:hypothetical protein n=1 Tax=unclassified Kitasatospora TaxID=2633591 RepID=UPI003692FBA0